MAGTFLPPQDIAILINIKPSARSRFVSLCKHSAGTPEYEAYHRGRLNTKYELRQNMIKLAKAGSPTAEPMVERFMKEQTYGS